MKKCFFLLLLVSQIIFGQVTKSPGTPTATDEITITLNTTGTGLASYTGDIYAHTGVTVNGAQWQSVIGTWGSNTTQPKLTKINATTYQLIITPNVHSFYNVATTETISEINVVFRSSDGNQQISPDIHIAIYKAALNIAITSPTENQTFNPGSSTTITAESPINADLELFVNNISVKTATNTNSISFTYTFTTTGQQTFKAVISNGTNIKKEEIYVYVKTTTLAVPKPTGISNGVTKNTDKSVTFLLLAPNKSDVFLIGDFNNWALHQDYQLTKDDDYFWITISGLDPEIEYAYQYYIDYDKKIADPYAEKILDKNNDQYISATNYPNLKAFPEAASGTVSTFLINETTYSWTSTSFTKPEKDKLVIYELLVRDFSEDDNYQAVIDKLDYLENLGINALELMPVNEFEGNDSWGYNVSNFFALDKAYGTKNKFKELVDKCHQRGIAVILDAVFNHSYSQCPLLQMYEYSSNGTTTNNPFYNNAHNFENNALQFGYDFNHESTYTQNYFKDVMSYWINEYKIDGFRLDFTKGFTNTYYSTSGDQWGNAYNQNRIDRLTDYANYVWTNHGNDVYIILEHLADNSEEKILANTGLMLWGNMVHNFNQNTMGYNSSDTDISWSYYANRQFNSPNLVSYMESHDEERLMYKNLQFGNSNGSYNVTSLATTLQRMEAAGVVYFTIPGPKMIWQFGELGYDISINQNGRTGRKPILWNYFDDPLRKNVYTVWATLAKLKQEHDVFSTTDVTLNVNGLGKQINLNHTSNNVVILANFDLVDKAINPNFTTTGTWYEYFTDSTREITNTTSTLTLSPGEYRMYSTVKFKNPLSVTQKMITNSVILYPNPTNDSFKINREVNTIVIYNINSEKITEFKGAFKADKEFIISELKKGLYILQISTENDVYYQKLLKK